MAGYSKTPLHKKLGLKHGMAAVVINPPDDYFALLGPDAPFAHWQQIPEPNQAFTHYFTDDRASLLSFLNQSRNTIAKDGMIWVSWPKKSSGIPSTVTEDVIRDLCLPIGLVDVKVCAVDEIWSGLKLVIRKELR